MKESTQLSAFTLPENLFRRSKKNQHRLVARRYFQSRSERNRTRFARLVQAERQIRLRQLSGLRRFLLVAQRSLHRTRKPAMVLLLLLALLVIQTIFIN